MLLVRKLCPPAVRSILDLWVAGSGLSSGDFYLEDSINRRQSKDLTLDSAAAGDAKVLFGPDNNGWYHLQINLAKLTATDNTKAASSLTNLWTRIVIRDKSGAQQCIGGLSIDPVAWCLLASFCL